ncbi:hypothetical protein VTI74DRAFT_7022 [Chaetomium olivicolor]
MDPLSVLSVAAAGVQFVDFSSRLLSDTLEVYKSASEQTERVSHLEGLIRHLDALTSSIEEKSLQLRPNPAPDTPDATFLDACRQCKEISKELANIVEKLGVEAAKRSSRCNIKFAGPSLVAAVKGIMSDSKIKDLTEKLRTVQGQMQMAAMVSLWERAQESGTTVRQAAQQHLDVLTAGNPDQTTKETATYLLDIAKGDIFSRDPGARRQLVRDIWSAEWSLRTSGWDQEDQATELIELRIIESSTSCQFRIARKLSRRHTLGPSNGCSSQI